MKRIARLLPALAATLCVSVAQANLVANGDFETGDYAGWTLFGNAGAAGIDNTTPHSGQYTARFGSGGGVVIQQMLATTPGETYDIDFWFSTQGPAKNHFVFDWDGNAPEWDLVDSNPGFATFHFVLQASSALTPLTFAFQQQDGFWRLDDVAVTAAAVPLPSSMLLAGLGLALMRRRAGR